jgi:hypothetical protein
LPEIGVLLSDEIVDFIDTPEPVTLAHPPVLPPPPPPPPAPVVIVVVVVVVVVVAGDGANTM